MRGIIYSYHNRFHFSIQILWFILCGFIKAGILIAVPILKKAFTSIHPPWTLKLQYEIRGGVINDQVVSSRGFKGVFVLFYPSKVYSDVCFPPLTGLQQWMSGLFGGKYV